VIRLLLPEEFVIGYPALLTISVEAFPEDAFGVDLPPLAQTIGQGKSGGIGIEVSLWPKDESGGSVVGSTTYGIREPGAQREEPQTAEGGRRARLQPGEPYFTTVGRCPRVRRN